MYYRKGKEERRKKRKKVFICIFYIAMFLGVVSIKGRIDILK